MKTNARFITVLSLLALLVQACAPSAASTVAVPAPASPAPTVESPQGQPPASATPLSVTRTAKTASLTLTSPEVTEDGALPTEYTCDGTSATLPLTWSGAPAETKSFAVVMHHVASPDDIHRYWVLYDIPANVNSLSKNSAGIGTLGTNSVNGKTAYAPPCSKGPGEKVYTYTVYALSAQPQFSVPASQVNRKTLLEAIQDITLASAELHITYTRK